MIGQHDAARADADRLRPGRDMGDDQRGRRRGDGPHIVMLGDPKPLIAPAFGVLAKPAGIIQGVCAGKALAHASEF